MTSSFFNLLHNNGIAKLRNINLYTNRWNRSASDVALEQISNDVAEVVHTVMKYGFLEYMKIDSF